MTALAALLSHWRRHPLQLAMLLLGLALATGLFSGVQAINAEARASYDQAAGVLGQDRLARLIPARGATMDEARFAQLRRAGWQVSPVIEGRTRLGEARVTLLGIDPLSAPAPAQIGGFQGGAGLVSFITFPGEALANAETIAAMGPLPGDMTARIVPDLPVGTVLVDIGIAQDLLDAAGRLSRLLVAPEQPAGLPDWQAIAPDLLWEEPEGAGDLARLTDSFHLNLTAFGLLSFAVGMFIVHSTVGLAFEQRRTMFRTLRALGVTAHGLMALLLAELLMLALLAGGAGVVLGWFVASALLPDVAATLRGLYGAAVPGSLTLRPEWWGLGLGMAVAGTLLAGGNALWRVWRLPLMAPARPRAWARASERATLLQGGAAVLLALVALGLGLRGGGLVVGFALLGCLLMSAALALPVMLNAALALAQRAARGPLAEWFVADARQQLPGLSLALMALMLALAANIGVGTMVQSFRTTFTGWLDQRLAFELYVTARTEDEAAAFRVWAGPRADAVLPVWRVDGRIAGLGGEVYGVQDHATYRDHWPLLQAAPDAWDRLASGTGVMVNEQAARRQGLNLGQMVELSGGPPLPLVAVYSDYGNPAAQAILGLDLFLERHPEAPRLSHALRVAPDRAAALAEEIRAEFDLPPDRVLDQAAVKAFSMAVFERTFAVTGALNVLTLGVASLALLAALLTLAGMRLAQLAPVWAAGVTRAGLAWMELGRMLLLAAMTALAALPVGLLLAWVLLAVINVEAFGWRLPMQLFPADWLRLGGLAVMAAGLAALWPVRRLATIGPGDLLRVFAHER